jgi:ATP-dependent Zn protease
LRNSWRQNSRRSIFQIGITTFIQVSTGASDDLQKVRNLVRAMITKFGMSDAFPNFAPV